MRLRRALGLAHWREVSVAYIVLSVRTYVQCTRSVDRVGRHSQMTSIRSRRVRGDSMSPLARAFDHEAGMASRRARARTEITCTVARTDGQTDRARECFGITVLRGAAARGNECTYLSTRRRALHYCSRDVAHQEDRTNGGTRTTTTTKNKEPVDNEGVNTPRGIYDTVILRLDLDEGYGGVEGAAITNNVRNSCISRCE